MASSYQIFYIALVVSLGAAGLTLLIPILPLFLEQYGNSGEGEFRLGLSSSIYALAGLIAAPFFGILADKYGEKYILVGSITAYGISNFFTLFADSFEIFILYRAISGIFGSSLIAPALSLISHISNEKNRAKDIAKVTAGVSFGTIIGPLFGGLLNTYINIYAPFIVTGLFGIVAGVSGIFLLPKPEKKLKPVVMDNIENEPNTSNNLSESVSGQKIRTPELRVLDRKFNKIRRMTNSIGTKIPIPKKIFLLFLVMTFFNAGSWLLLEPVYLFHFYDDLGYTSVYFGIFVTIFGSFVFVGEVFLGGLSDKYGRIPLIIAGSLVLCLFYAYLPFARDLYLLFFVATLAGIGVGLVTPALNALISEVSIPKFRAFVFSLVTVTQNTAAVIFPTLGGYLKSSSLLNIFEVALVSASLVSLVAFFAFFLRFKKPNFRSEKNEVEGEPLL